MNGITKTMVGLSNVDDTSDLSKPVSTATQTALNLKLNTASPSYTGALANSGSSFNVDASGNLTATSVTTGSINVGTAISNINSQYQPRNTNLNNINNNLTTVNALINTFTPTDTPAWTVSAGSVASNAESITNAWGYVENKAQQLTLNQGNGANQDLSIQNISTTAYAGQTLIIKVWVKLGTATNFDLVVNNGAAWNTVGGQCFTSANGLNTSTYTQISLHLQQPTE